MGGCDPFVNLDQPVIVKIPPGDYPVRVTIADVSPEQDGSNLREAYLSLILSPAESVAVEAARGPDGQFYGGGVSTGTVAFVDAEAVTGCMPHESTWYEEVFESEDPPTAGSTSWTPTDRIRPALQTS
ncbi:hypothetical protein QFZ33_003192 [Arthrobacter globiformis]|nr:hypothetical protein [Arthrobacter globiformis]